MKKARTLLAIWLALILTLTLFPTALADGGDGGTNPDPNGGTAASFKVNVQFNDGIANPTQNVTNGTWTTGDLVFTFMLKEGYTNPSFTLKIGENTVTDLTLSEPDATGKYTLTVPADKINGDVNLVLSATKVEETTPPATQVNDPDENQTTPPAPQGNGSGGDQTTPPDDGTGAKTKFTISWAVDESFDKAKIGNWPSGAWATNEEGNLSLPNLTYPGFTFQGWTKDNDTTPLKGAVKFEADTTLTAKFVRNYTFTFAGVDDITSDKPTLESAAPGATITLPAAPTARGKEFKEWSISGAGITGTQTVAAGGKFTIPTTEPTEGATAITITATWSDLPKITINFQPEAGTKSVSGMPDSDVSYENEVYKLPSTRPSRHDGSYEFARWQLKVGSTTYNFQPGNSVNWSELGIKDGTTVTFIADFSWTYYADHDDDDDDDKPSYSKDEYRIRVTCSDGGWVSPAGSTYVREGRNLTVTFAPYSGYAIDGVYIDGVLDNSHDGVYTFRDVDENHTIYVRYVRESSGSTGGGHYWDDDTSPKTGDTSAPLGMGLGAGSLALIAFLIARRMRRA